MSDFTTWLTFAVGADETQPGGEEGGWNQNDPLTIPPGQNPTYRGIEFYEWCSWRGDHTLTQAQFRALLTRTEIGRIAQVKYWSAYNVPLLPVGPTVLFADGVWNGGGVANLQTAMNAIFATGLTADDDPGPKTLAAMQQCLPTADPAMLIYNYVNAADSRYRVLGQNPKFAADLPDWLGRLGRCKALALQVAGVTP